VALSHCGFSRFIITRHFTFADVNGHSFRRSNLSVPIRPPHPSASPPPAVFLQQSSSSSLPPAVFLQQSSSSSPPPPPRCASARTTPCGRTSGGIKMLSATQTYLSALISCCNHLAHIRAAIGQMGRHRQVLQSRGMAYLIVVQLVQSVERETMGLAHRVSVKADIA